MSSKSNGANYGAKRIVKAVAWNPLYAAGKPKKKPVGHEENEEDEKDPKSRRS